MVKYQLLMDLDEGVTQVFELHEDSKHMILLKEFPSREQAEAYVDSLHVGESSGGVNHDHTYNP